MPKSCDLTRSQPGSNLPRPARSKCRNHQERDIRRPVVVTENDRLLSSWSVARSQTRFGSYWSPAPSEVVPFALPVGPSFLKRHALLLSLSLAFCNASIFCTHILYAAFQDASQLQNVIHPCLVTFYSSAFLSAVFAPLVIHRWTPAYVFVICGLAGIFYGFISYFLQQIFLLLFAAGITGGLFGLTSVLQGTTALNLGLQYSHVKQHVDGKITAGDWYLWTQVLVQCGLTLGSMICSSAKMWLIPDSSAWSTIRHPLDSRRKCGTHMVENPADAASATVRNIRSSFNQTSQAENQDRAIMIDEPTDQLNMMLFLLVVGMALMATVLAGAASLCFNRAKNRNRKLKNNVLEEELLSVSEATQIYTESTVHRLRGMVDLFLFDHKLQTMLPSCFLRGLQYSFVVTTFSKDFVLCALSKEYVGWVLAVYFGMSGVALVVVFQISRQVKRLQLLIWTTLFQAGIEVALVVWLPGSHDKPIFFIVAGTFGLTEGAFLALQAGILVRVFAHDWASTYSYLTAFRCAGCAVGAGFGLVLSAASQIYTLFAFLLVAFLAHGLLEWKYDMHIVRKQKSSTYL